MIAAALGDIARAKRMAQLAKETSITCDGLYKALSSTGNLSFDTVRKAIKAFELKWMPQPLRKLRGHLSKGYIN